MAIQQNDPQAVHAYWQMRASAAEKDIEMALAAEAAAQNSVDRKLIRHFLETRAVERETFHKMAKAAKAPAANGGA